MIIGTMRPEEARVFDGSEGHHKLTDGTSIEVFWDDADTGTWSDEPRNFDADGEPVSPGWYWWACQPGCLPDGDAVGPFGTSHRALADAEELADGEA